MIGNNEDVLLTYNDLQQVISNAKAMYSSIAFPVQLQDNKNVIKDLNPSEIEAYCIVESMILLLNKNQALKRLPVFKKGR
jgi:hypothetical protein